MTKKHCRLEKGGFFYHRWIEINRICYAMSNICTKKAANLRPIWSLPSWCSNWKQSLRRRQLQRNPCQLQHFDWGERQKLSKLWGSLICLSIVRNPKYITICVQNLVEWKTALFFCYCIVWSLIANRRTKTCIDKSKVKQKKTGQPPPGD